jgi:hypothetical protein
MRNRRLLSEDLIVFEKLSSWTEWTENQIGSCWGNRCKYLARGRMRVTGAQSSLREHLQQSRCSFVDFRERNLLESFSYCGRVAQLGEHLLCKQGVAGSIPATSTNHLLTISVSC